MESTHRLVGKTVAIAGASSGMGRAVALAAAEEGANLVLLARRRDALEATAASARSTASNARVAILTADASDVASLQDAFSAEPDALRRIDVLVNSVGTNIARRALNEMTPESWSSIIDANLTSAFNLTQAVLPVMRRQGNGLIIHIASVAAKRADRSGAAYQASKAGVVALAHATMEEERANGLRVTAILPGMTDTPLLDKRPVPLSASDRQMALKPEDVAAACLFVMGLPPRAHVAELLLQPSRS